MTPTIDIRDDGTAVLTADVGFIRLALDQGRIAAHSSAMAPSVSPGWKNTWSAHSGALRAALALLPPPADPRNPYGAVTTTAPLIAVVAPDLPAAAPGDDLSDLLG